MAQPSDNGGVRCQNDIILILPHGILSLGGEYADNLEWDAADPYGLIDGTRVGKEVVSNSLPEDAHLRGGLDILIRKELAVRQRPFADLKIIYSHSLN